MSHSHITCTTQDKTFGLKNKKGKKQQQFVKQVTNQVKFGGSSQQKREAAEIQAKVGVYMYKFVSNILYNDCNQLLSVQFYYFLMILFWKFKKFF